jgi:hypothetical protein
MLSHNTWDPLKDGIDHCNAYSRARTPLGRALSNFANIGFVHPTYGTFASVEGFWYFLATGCKHQDLHRLYGVAAKRYGQSLPEVPMELFDEQIEEAIMMKIEQNPNLLGAVLGCNLPVTHYYVYGTTTPLRIVDKTGESSYLTNAIQRIKEKYPQRPLE